MVAYPRLIVLLGPNGAGKSTLGHMLAALLGWRFISSEELFLRLFPSLDAYYQQREAGYAALEAQVRDALAAATSPVVLEEVGLSELAQRMLDGLAQDHPTVFVNLKIDPERCVERVQQRGTARNFPKDAAFVAATWERYARGSGRYPFALELDTAAHSPEALVAAIQAQWPDQAAATTRESTHDRPS